MSLIFNLLLHGLLIGSLGFFVFAIFRISVDGTDQIERVLRVAALFAGAMVTLGAQQGGLNYASFTVNALSGARPASAITHVAASVIPGLLGAGLGFYVVRTLKRSETMAIRVLAFVGMLATTAFIQLYATATNSRGIDLGAAALPNVTFTAGVILTVIFTWDRSKAGARHSAPASALSGLLRRGSVLRSTDSQHAGRSGAVAPPPARDPFADFDE